MLYIVTAGLDDGVTGMLKQYIFEVLSYQPYGIENLYAKGLYALRDMVDLVMALDVSASVLYCTDYEWNVSY
jgi:hypothetical protein